MFDSETDEIPLGKILKADVVYTESQKLCEILLVIRAVTSAALVYRKIRLVQRIEF